MTYSTGLGIDYTDANTIGGYVNPPPTQEPVSVEVSNLGKVRSINLRPNETRESILDLFEYFCKKRKIVISSQDWGFLSNELKDILESWNTTLM